MHYACNPRERSYDNPLSLHTASKVKMPRASDLSEDKVRANLIAAVETAERQFGVRALDSILGCGQNGCAVPLEDGHVLKITMEPNERNAVDAVTGLSPKDAAGFARIYHAPIGVTFESEEAGWFYVRERFDRFPTRDEIMPVFDAMYPRERVQHDMWNPDTAAGYIAKISRFSRIPGLGPLYRTLTMLARRGVLLYDVARNLGKRRNGTIAAFDAASAQASEPLAYENDRDY